MSTYYIVANVFCIIIFILFLAHDRLGTTDDTAQNCIRRADKKLYSDKKQRKSR